MEECIFHVRSNTKWAREHQRTEVQARELVLPLGVLKGGAGEFARATRMVARSAASDEQRIRLEDALDGIGKRWIQTIDDYRFPVVTLCDSTPAEAVCTIFEP